MKKRGFTIIEILVVVALIAILAAIITPAIFGNKSKARDVRRITDIKQIAGAVEIYKRENGTYPVPSLVAGCSGSNQIWSSWGACWTTTLTSALFPSAPIDPQNNDLGGCAARSDCHLYTYCASADGSQFVIGVNLENTPSPTQSAPSLCSVTTGNNVFWVGD